MANIVKSLGLLALVCSAPSMAQVSHVSINSRMFELGAYPKLRVNVIADNQDMSRLEFVVQQASGEERLMVEEINRFLVLLTGVEDVKDSSAKLLVREYRLDRWYDVKSINLFVAAKPASATLTTKAVPDTKNTTTAGALKSADKVGIKPVTVVAESKPLVEVTPAVTVATAANTQSKVPTVEVVTGFKFPEAANKQNTSATETVVPEIVKTANNEQKQNIAETASQTPAHCQLTYLAGETLWRIANRYAKDWDVSVYGAMLAIYEANPVAFSKNRINALKSNAVLSCPSKMILDQHSDAKEARVVFEAKEAGK
ncbi:FimV/HubP family polar landmark protein [Shewanella oncorhynchi]|uniref:FimV/HubP family polar landmark protein n=1 Tax=Shewanella oncorhynchi TaxID=2726434 RepID=UPI003D7A00C8